MRATRLEEALRKALSGQRPVPLHELPIGPPEGRGQILVADDSENNRFLIDANLRGTQYELHFAEDGAIALRKALGHTYDVILMDVQMPQIDGYEATRHIRAFEKSRRRTPVTIIALTAHALKTEAGRAREAGCTSYLSNPFTKAALLREIGLSLSARPTMETDPGVAAPLPREIQDLVPDYVRRRSEDADQIQVELDAGGFEAIGMIAHNLKGFGTSFGLPRISEVGARLEIGAKAMDREANGSSMRFGWRLRTLAPLSRP